MSENKIEHDTQELPINNPETPDSSTHNVEKSDSIKRKIAPQSKYKPEYGAKLIAHLSKGLSVDTFGHTVGVASKSTIYKWIEDHPEFADAHKEALQAGQNFFETRLSAKISGQEIQGVDTKKIDTTCLIFALKTRFHKTYGDRSKIEHSGDKENPVQITIDSDDGDL